MRGEMLDAEWDVRRVVKARWELDTRCMRLDRADARGQCGAVAATS
jgi:hypothetical protein